MLHDNIKRLVARSISADRVIFGESVKRHPLGFEAFNIDLSIDHALSYLTSASYDSITSLHMECANLTKALKRTGAIDVSSRTLKLYKESKIADAFRKVMAFIKKCIKFIFKDLPLAIFRKIKAFFSRKSSKTKYAKAHEEAAKKRKDEMKEAFDKMKERTDGMAEELIQTKKEVYSDIIERHKNADKELKAAVDRINENLADIEESKARIKKSLDSMKANDGAEKSKAREKKSLDSMKASEDEAYMNKLMTELGIDPSIPSDKGIDELLEELGIDPMESSKKNIDELMKELNESFAGDDPSKNIYRASELRDMAEGILNGIETGKISIDPVFKLGNFNYFKTPNGKALMEHRAKRHTVDNSLNAFMAITLLFACPAIPYMSDTVQKYFNIPVKDYTVFPTASADAVVQMFYEQVRSFDQYIDGFRKKGKLPQVKDFTLPGIRKSYVDRLMKTMVIKDGSTRISLDALSSLPSGIIYDSVIAPGDIDKGLRATMMTAIDLKQTIRTMSETADKLMHLKMDEIESYFDDGTSMEETLSYIGELVKAITAEIHGISNSVLTCIISLGAAEEKLLNALVSEDDAIHTITLSQLASYIAKDADMMKRVKALVMK